MIATTEKLPVKRRSKGEQTRNLILESAIEVLAKHGIKGTTHRAIANHADIQLSLTTYYFKDIQELVNQAFILSSSRTSDSASIVWQQAFEMLENINKSDLRKTNIRVQLRESLTLMATQYLYLKVTEQPTSLIIEQLLFTEIQVSPKLRAVATSHREALMSPFVRLCSFFNKKTPEIDADIMLTVFTQLEYRQLAIPKEMIDMDYIQKVVHKNISYLLKLKD